MKGLREHDSVELTRSVDGWPAGTPGAVVSLDEDLATVEIAEELSVSTDDLDLVTVPHDWLRLVDRESTHR